MTGAATADGRDVRVMSLIGLAHSGSHYYQLVLPPLFPILKDDLGVGYAELGLLMTLFYVTSGVAQTIAGFLVDRFGARRMLLLGFGLLCVSSLSYGFAPSFWALVPLVMLAGLGNSVFHPADYSILTASVADRRLGRAYGIHTLGGNLGWAAAPVSVLALAHLTDWRTALVIVGAAGLPVLALLALQREHMREDRTHIAAQPAPRAATRRERGAAALAPLFARPVLMCFLYFFLLSMALIGVQNFLPATLLGLYGTPLVTANAALTGFLLGASGGVILGGVIADRSRRHNVVVAWGLSGGAVLIALLGLGQPPAPLLIGTITAAGFLVGATTPSRDMLVRGAAPKGATGRIFGFVYSGLDVGSSIAPLAIGLMLDRGRADLVLWFVAFVLVAGVGSAQAVRSRPQPAAQPAE